MAAEPTPAGENTPEKKVEMTAEQKAILGAATRREVVMAINVNDVLTAKQVDEVVKATSDEAEAKMKAADMIVEARLKEEGPQTKPSAEITADATERFKEGATAGLMHRAGMGGERNEFTGMTLRETARASLDVQNIRPSGHSALDMVASAFTMGAMHSPGDFTTILADVANKAMLRGYEEAEETFQEWTVEGSVSDFKPTKRVDLDTFPSLRAVEDGAEYKYATVGDHGETITIATYGELFNISRQTIINDDLGAFTRVPQKMGRAAIRTVGNLAYAVLTDNANMSDGTALFHADHNNLAGSGAAPSVTSFNAAFEAMMKQKDRSENAHALNIVPRYGLFPVGLRSQAMQVLESEHDPAKTSRSANTARNMVTPIIDARLTGTAWYFVADPSRIDTVEVSYLDGNSAPFLDQMETWTRDGASFKVRIDAGVKALAWQGLYKDGGA